MILKIDNLEQAHTNETLFSQSVLFICYLPACYVAFNIITTFVQTISVFWRQCSTAMSFVKLLRLILMFRKRFCVGIGCSWNL